ncbi:MAG: N-acetyltransferase family protein [Candidatus Limnocylindrales bacterium]
MSVVVRPATPADAEALARLHLRSWRVTYDPLLTPADRRLIRLEERRTAWQARLAGPSGTAWLAERAGQVLGLVAVGPAEEPDLDARRVGEVTSIHVSPERQGVGLGRQLLTLGEATLRKLGYREAILWVLADNAAARRFYEHLGWLLDGAAVRREMGGVAGLPIVDEVRYRRSL